MTLQDARDRLHREAARKSVRGAQPSGRCACGRLIVDTSSGVYAFWRRRVRVCMDCVERDQD